MEHRMLMLKGNRPGVLNVFFFLVSQDSPLTVWESLWTPHNNVFIEPMKCIGLQHKPNYFET